MFEAGFARRTEKKKGTEMANIGATTAFYKVETSLTRANSEVSKSMERLATGKANNAETDLPMLRWLIPFDWTLLGQKQVLRAHRL